MSNLDNTRHGASVRIRSGASYEEIMYCTNQLKMRLARDVISKLMDGGYHVIKIEYSERKEPSGYSPGAYDTEITGRVHIGKVRHEDVMLPVVPDYDAMSYRRLSLTAIDELKLRLRRGIDWKLYYAKRRIKGIFKVRKE